MRACMCTRTHKTHTHRPKHARTQTLKTRGPDKELREPVRVSAPIRPKATVCVCRQAHCFLHFIQCAHTHTHTRTPSVFHTNILPELPRLADMLFQTRHTKGNGTRLKRQTSPTFPPSHTVGEARRGTKASSKRF